MGWVPLGIRGDCYLTAGELMGTCLWRRLEGVGAITVGSKVSPERAYRGQVDIKECARCGGDRGSRN